MKDYAWLEQHVISHKGADYQRLLPVPKEDWELRLVADDRLFSLLTRRIFRAGLKHALVDSKWPAFEQAFWGFDPHKVARMSDEQLENLLQNAGLIRHWGKLKATRLNALMISEIAAHHGCFANWLADWPSQNIVQLWAELKQRGSQLGGNSASYFLRMAGKDTFILTDDVVVALKAQGIVTKRPAGKRDLARVQAAFNLWQQQSGRPLCQLSRMLAFTVGW